MRCSSLHKLAAFVALVLAALCATACAGDAASVTPRQPYKVVLLPVEGAARALASNGRRGDDFVPLAMTADEMSKAVFDGIRKSNAFSELIAAPAGIGADAASYGDELARAADFARSVNADLLLRVTVKSAEMRDLGNNGSSFWSTFTWFMVPLPIWFADDRTYDTDLAVEAALYEVRDTQKPTASVVASSGKQDLDLWDRGLSLWVPIIPPAFLKGSPSTVSNTLTERAMAQLMDALVEELRTREIPARFEVTLTPLASSLEIRIVSRRALRSLEVFVGGKRAESWSETGLRADQGSSLDQLAYTRAVKVDTSGTEPGAGVEVRVVAEDEAGAREVRTLIFGRSSRQEASK